jgi:phage shock protein A
MTRNWKLLGIQTVLAGALALSPASAADSDTPAKPPDLATVSKQLEEMKKTLEGLQTSVLAFNKAMDDERAQRIKADSDAEVRLQQLISDMSELRKQISQVRQDMDVLKARPSVSAYPPSGQAAAGRVRMVNSYMEPVTVVVNGRAYPLQPGETRLTDPIPSGTFTYEVLGVQPPMTRPLAAGETFTVTVYPR